MTATQPPARPSNDGTDLDPAADGAVSQRIQALANARQRILHDITAAANQARALPPAKSACTASSHPTRPGGANMSSPGRGRMRANACDNIPT